MLPFNLPEHRGKCTPHQTAVAVIVLLFYGLFLPSHFYLMSCLQVWIHWGPRVQLIVLLSTVTAQAPICNRDVGPCGIGTILKSFFFFSFSQVGVTSLKQRNLSGRWRQQTRSPPRLQGVATGMQDSTSVSRMAKQVRAASFRRYTTTDTEATVSRVQGLLV